MPKDMETFAGIAVFADEVTSKLGHSGVSFQKTPAKRDESRPPTTPAAKPSLSPEPLVQRPRRRR